MIDQAKLQDVLRCYKRDFVSFVWNDKDYKRWNDEKFKWEAVQCFKDHWAIDAEDFSLMLKQSLAKTKNLLATAGHFPRGMIEGFAQSAPEEVRAMFIALFDENRDVYERISEFKQQSSVMLEKYGGDAKQHYQYENAICTYLWLRFPDKYYIYKYSTVQKVAQILVADYRFNKGAYADNIRNFLKMYDEISAALKEDAELVQKFKENRTDSCYPDPELKTLTVDLCFYIANFYKDRKAPPIVDEWFPDPAVYTPNISVEQWNALLRDTAVFDENSLNVIKAFYEVGGAATCSELAKKYGNNPMHYSGIVSKLANRVQKATNCPMIPEELSENAKWWTILFLGKHAEKERQGVYIWRLRDELKTAIKELLYNSEPAYSVYTKDNFLSEVYMTEERYDALSGVLQNKLNIILQGAPGVGKTFAARRLAWSIMGEKDDSRIEFVQFHQNYSYEDFMMGYKPAGDSFELKYGIFYRFCQKAANQPDKPFFFIIDEINRGNLSKIFGELLMLIEKDYRGTKATLAYNGMQFSVPKNLYIIGMMNTADRSLAMIDYALRRRFSFFDIEPGFDSQGFLAYQNSLNNETLNALIAKVKDLNNEIAQDKSLGKGFCIGHSYFCGRTNCTEEWLRAVVDYDILPMLREYWFDETNKLQRWENILQGVFQS